MPWLSITVAYQGLPPSIKCLSPHGPPKCVLAPDVTRLYDIMPQLYTWDIPSFIHWPEVAVISQKVTIYHQKITGDTGSHPHCPTGFLRFFHLFSRAWKFNHVPSCSHLYPFKTITEKSCSIIFPFKTISFVFSYGFSYL